MGIGTVHSCICIHEAELESCSWCPQACVQAAPFAGSCHATLTHQRRTATCPAGAAASPPPPPPPHLAAHLRQRVAMAGRRAGTVSEVWADSRLTHHPSHKTHTSTDPSAAPPACPPGPPVHPNHAPLPTSKAPALTHQRRLAAVLPVPADNRLDVHSVVGPRHGGAQAQARPDLGAAAHVVP